MGYGEFFRGWLHLICKEPTAAVATNTFVSSYFKLWRVTCHLLCHFFSCPGASIQHEDNFLGINCMYLCKLILYVDDILTLTSVWLVLVVCILNLFCILGCYFHTTNLLKEYRKLN